MSFPGDAPVAPSVTDRNRVSAAIPAGAVSGHPSVETASGDADVSPRRLAIVDEGEVPAPGSFELTSAHARPRKAFFDESRPIKLSYRFAASERTGVRVELIRKKGRKKVRGWRKRGRLPYTQITRRWNGTEGDGDAANDGIYRFRVGPFGGHPRAAGSVKLFGYRFPVRGSHGYGGPGERFGAPRSGGRVHQGQDVFAACGTPLEAARGGRIQRKAYDPVLYGHYAVVDITKSPHDHMYVHMASPARFGEGKRIHTGQRIGRVGRSGNARSEPCQLHFELWPHGWRNGNPVDPLPALRRWDGWS